jgi:hypothetical protein
VSSQKVKFEYDPERNILFTEDDFDILTESDVEEFWAIYRRELERVGRKVHLVTKIDGLYIKPELDGIYGQRARQVSGEWFINFSRYGDTAVGRLGITDAAKKADFVTSVHKTREEAVAAVLAREGRQ